ncbi:MAG: hypothetical protein JRE18_12540, partial [Deltaproteobacteria bacterium]|nr:hypothetical protein [Deltaproteobacteria bacterium]
EYELARGSWRVLPGTDELVFDAEPEKLWKQLAPAQEQRAAVTRHRSARGDRVPASRSTLVGHLLFLPPSRRAEMSAQ